MNRLLLTFLTLACSIQLSAQVTLINGNLNNPDGTGFSGRFLIQMPKAGVTNFCNPALIVPTVGVVTVVNGVVTPTVLQATDCLTPRTPYYVTLYDSNNQQVYSDNWYIPSTTSGAVNIGMLVPTQLAAAITVSIPQAIISTPATGQIITQPAGTALTVNNLVVTGTCTGCGGGGGGGGNYQYLQVLGSPLTPRPKLNFIWTSGITITPSDNGVDTTSLSFAIAPPFNTLMPGTLTNAGTYYVGNGADFEVTGTGKIDANYVSGTMFGFGVSDNEIPVYNATYSAALWTSLPNCPDTAGNHLNYQTATHTFVCGTSSSGGGGSSSFASLTSGTNNSASMICDTGCSITPINSGTINATQWEGTVAAGVAPPAAYYIPISISASTVEWYGPLPNCLDTGGQHLNFNTSTYLFSCGTSGSGGGFANPMTTYGDIIFENSVLSPARLAGSTSSLMAFLTQTGTGSVSNTPVWSTNIAVGGTASFTSIINGPNSYAGGELPFGTTTVNAGSGITTEATGSPSMDFDHRGTGNTGYWVWRNGTSAANEQMALDQTGNLILQNGGAYTWNPTGKDTSLSRDSAGVVDFGTGAAGSRAGSWKATNGTLSGSLFISSTPSYPTSGSIYGSSGFSSTYNGLSFFSNATYPNVAYNTALPAWLMSLGPVDNATYPSGDAWSLWHETVSGGTWVEMANISGAGAMILPALGGSGTNSLCADNTGLIKISGCPSTSPSFTGPGTGATSTPFTNQIEGMMILGSNYGMVCDGSHATQDTAGLGYALAAVNTVTTFGPIIVQLPAGTCQLNATVTVSSSNFTLQGVAGATIIQAATNAWLSTMMQFTGSNITLRDFTVDGNISNYGTIWGVAVYSGTTKYCSSGNCAGGSGGPDVVEYQTTPGSGPAYYYKSASSTGCTGTAPTGTTSNNSCWTYLTNVTVAAVEANPSPAIFSIMLYFPGASPSTGVSNIHLNNIELEHGMQGLYIDGVYGAVSGTIIDRMNCHDFGVAYEGNNAAGDNGLTCVVVNVSGIPGTYSVTDTKITNSSFTNIFTPAVGGGWVASGNLGPGGTAAFFVRGDNVVISNNVVRNVTQRGGGTFGGTGGSSACAQAWTVTGNSILNTVGNVNNGGSSGIEIEGNAITVTGNNVSGLLGGIAIHACGQSSPNGNSTNVTISGNTLHGLANSSPLAVGIAFTDSSIGPTTLSSVTTSGTSLTCSSCLTAGMNGYVISGLGIYPGTTLTYATTSSATLSHAVTTNETGIPVKVGFPVTTSGTSLTCSGCLTSSMNGYAIAGVGIIPGTTITYNNAGSATLSQAVSQNETNIFVTLGFGNQNFDVANNIIDNYECGVFTDSAIDAPLSFSGNRFTNMGSDGNLCGFDLTPGWNVGLDASINSPLQGSAVIASPSPFNIFSSSSFAAYPKPLSIPANYLNVLGAEIRIHASINWYNTTSGTFYAFPGISMNGLSTSTAYTSTALHCTGPTTSFTCGTDITITGKVIVVGGSGAILFTGTANNLFAASATFPSPQTENSIIQPQTVSVDLTIANYIEMALLTGTAGSGYSTSLADVSYEFYFPASAL